MGRTLKRLPFAMLFLALLSAGVAAQEPAEGVRSLFFLRGNWKPEMEFTGSSEKFQDLGKLEVTDLRFTPILQDRFLELSYTVSFRGKMKEHRVIIGPEGDGRLKAQTFTSEGESHVTYMDVEKTEKGILLKSVTEGHKASVTAAQSDDESIVFEFTQEEPRKVGPVRVVLRKEAATKDQ